VALLEQTIGNAHRERCYDCYRPAAACFCAAIPTIENQTEVLILQHRRERFHPFNTARIVSKALANSRLLVDHIPNLARRLKLQPRAGLLYPGPAAALLTELAPEERPEQLVVLDGTWHHAKTLLREIPALRQLPRYRLAPESPSRYRIRREPTAAALSTIEATVAALRVLEPQTAGFEQLLAAFDMMVDSQLKHPHFATMPRFREHDQRPYANLPRALLGDLSNLVVAYGEAPAGQRGRKRTAGPPVYWVAERLATGETFSCLLNPSPPPTDAFLGHLQLRRDDFASAISLPEAKSRWSGFCRPGDTITVFNPGTAGLLAQLASDDSPCLVLKSVHLPWDNWPAPLDRVIADQQITAGPSRHPGRAGHRLANAVAIVRHLNWLAAESLSAPNSDGGDVQNP
jgi:DTW domain-containing protein